MTILAPLDDRICKVDDLYFPNITSAGFTPETYDGSFNLTGLSSPLTLNYKAIKIGNQITMNIQGMTSQVKSGTGKIGSTNALPVNLIPSASWAPFCIIDGSIGGQAVFVGLTIKPQGDPDVGEIQIYNAYVLNNDFTNTSVITIKPCQMTYVL